MLREVGTDLKVQQEPLRHADIRTTLNLYPVACSEPRRTAIPRWLGWGFHTVCEDGTLPLS